MREVVILFLLLQNMCRTNNTWIKNYCVLFNFGFRVKFSIVNNYISSQVIKANQNYSFLYSAQLKISIATWREKCNHWNKCKEGRKTAPTEKTPSFLSAVVSSSLPKRRSICSSIKTMKYCLMFFLLSLMYLFYMLKHIFTPRKMRQ